MKRKLLITFVLIVLIECCFIINKAFATQDLAGYRIKNYDVEMTVNEDNSIDIIEDIDVYFSEERHGIYRSIPLENNITRLDGTTSTIKAKVKNIKVSENYSKTTNYDKLEIKIGNASTYLIGDKSYRITYTYRLGKDPIKDADELYYNIIGTEWGTTIDHANFTITMPKEFDESKLGFSSGTKGSTRK